LLNVAHVPDFSWFFIVFCGAVPLVFHPPESSSTYLGGIVTVSTGLGKRELRTAQQCAAVRIGIGTTGSAFLALGECAKRGWLGDAVSVEKLGISLKMT